MNGELTKIEDIAPIVMFLATSGWWITGQVYSKHPIALTFCRPSLPMVAIRHVRLMGLILCWKYGLIYVYVMAPVNSFILGIRKSKGSWNCLILK
jgi:hypothetical protein